MFFFFFIFLGILISWNQTKIFSKSSIFSLFFSKMWLINSSILIMKKYFLGYSFLNFYYCNKGLIEYFFESFYYSSKFFNKFLNINSFFPWSLFLFSISFYLVFIFYFNF